jgi:hypothetical protein
MTIHLEAPKFTPSLLSGKENVGPFIIIIIVVIVIITITIT